MAFGTVCPKGTVMHVLGLVAGITCGGSLNLTHILRCVTGIAANQCMSASQRICGVAAMIEVYPLPIE